MLHLREPYRIFFPLGALFGVAGVSIWPLYSFGVVSTYSGRSHALVQIFGFLYAFIAGFLLTAVPRFTGTQPPSLPAQLSLAAMLLVAVVSSELRAFALGTVAFVAAHAMLLTLLARRFARRRQNPPPTFALVGLGLLAGAAGALLTSGVALELIPASWDLLGKRLLTEGMVMLLVLGIGGFLGPRLLGFAPPPSHSVAPPSSVSSVVASPVVESSVAGLVILIALVAEYGFDLPRMAYVRAFVVSTVMIGSLQLWKRPAMRTTLSWSIWIAHWTIASGVWVVAAAPRYRADFLHVLFIGGFSLLILAIGTRVTLSHGGYDLSEERRSWPLRIGVTLALVATLARLGAPFAANSYFAHLAWASLLWIGGVAWWSAYIVRRIHVA
jgi:uncharacterized protein involved in response to NO